MYSLYLTALTTSSTCSPSGHWSQLERWDVQRRMGEIHFGAPVQQAQPAA